jgi:hypothetical protein
VIWFFGLFAAIAGLFLLGLAARNLWKGRASRGWRRVPGRILRSFVFVDHGSKGGEGYTPKLEYEYTLDGHRYTSMRWRYGQTGAWSRKSADRSIAPFPAGTAVTVHVNPSDPTESVLISGTSPGNLAIAAAGLVFAGVAGVLIRRAM